MIVEIEIVAAVTGAITIVAAPAWVASAVDVAVITTVPEASAFTVPVLLTDAFVASLDAHVTVRARPASAFTDATSVTDSPIFSETLDGETVTPCT
ncbi:MAG TPA: hypothetical protein VG818_08725 [Gemmatimonadaceae bacterium]|nr:hypothetical protein [Gemmatimonadaceae bacterium]